MIDLGIVPDVRDALRAGLEDAARAADVVVTSGGVSVGVYDLVKDVLSELGAIDFWQGALGMPSTLGLGAGPKRAASRAWTKPASRLIRRGCSRSKRMFWHSLKFARPRCNRCIRQSERANIRLRPAKWPTHWSANSAGPKASVD